MKNVMSDAKSTIHTMKITIPVHVSKINLSSTKQLAFARCRTVQYKHNGTLTCINVPISKEVAKDGKSTTSLMKAA